MRLTTYVNAVAPLADVYDGYMIHSRGSHGSALSQEPLADVSPPDLTVVRTDLAVPVLTFITETDLVGERLGYAAARQPDSETIRTWEVPGTAHVDAYGLGIGDADDGSGVADDTLFAAMSAPSNLVYGGIITCDLPINAGPQTYVFRAAVAALANWVTSGEPPPTMPRIELDTSGAIVVDDNGNARGGIRTPQVDAPVAVLSGLGQAGDSFCGLFGTTAPFDAGQFSELYPDREAFLTAWNDAVDSAMTSGAMLAADGARLRAVAAARN